MSQERPHRARILIADSELLAAREYKALLRPEFEVVGVASNGSKLIESAGKLKPDIVIAQTDIPKVSGFEAGEEIKRQNRTTKLIYLSSSSEPSVAAQAFEHGASGYLVKGCAAQELVHAVRCISRGESYLCSQVTQSTLDLLILLADERNKKRMSRRYGGHASTVPKRARAVETRPLTTLEEPKDIASDPEYQR
jgi:DNA-binding NarL/FixJ family response regulator